MITDEKKNIVRNQMRDKLMKSENTSNTDNYEDFIREIANGEKEASLAEMELIAKHYCRDKLIKIVENPD